MMQVNLNTFMPKEYYRALSEMGRPVEPPETLLVDGRREDGSIVRDVTVRRVGWNSETGAARYVGEIEP